MTDRAAAGEAMRPPVGPAALPRIVVTFLADRAEYAPGDVLHARYRVEAVDPTTITAIERSVVWYTEGKGEEDFGVVFFDRLVADRSGNTADKPADPDLNEWQKGSFSTRLPPSPLSYEGLIVKIRWCVRVRLFFAGGRDFVSEHVFFVGDIPVARPLELAVP
jgi:hypothetical protein